MDPSTGKLTLAERIETAISALEPALHTAEEHDCDGKPEHFILVEPGVRSVIEQLRKLLLLLEEVPDVDA